MDFETNLESIRPDMLEILRLFDPNLSGKERVVHDLSQEGCVQCNTVRIDGRESSRRDSLPQNCDKLLAKRLTKRHAKLALYEAMASFTGRDMPWGSLTGIRPTRLYYQLSEERGEQDLRGYFQEVLHVSPKKTALLEDVVFHQRGLLNDKEHAADIYVGIPFCTSRCAYCSFLSAEIDRVSQLVPAYVDALVKEIEALKRLVKEAGLAVRAVYVGGGTPTSLPAHQLRRVLDACAFGQREFTCEAGRPDTIDAAKLDAMAAAGVNRISVNPQTFSDSTLAAIGRRHTVADTLTALELAAAYPFSVNMDLIAGLPGEDRADFNHSLKRAVELAPDNVTVHTLALKSGAALKNAGYAAQADVPGMVEDAYAALKASGYAPYYLYRQKYMAGNLENVGYAREGAFCLYNVDIMEENTSILAAGANAISKRVIPGQNRIERQANNKDIAAYLANLEVEIARKRKLFFCEQPPENSLQ